MFLCCFCLVRQLTMILNAIVTVSCSVESDTIAGVPVIKVCNQANLTSHGMSRIFSSLTSYLVYSVDGQSSANDPCLLA